MWIRRTGLASMTEQEPPQARSHDSTRARSTRGASPRRVVLWACLLSALALIPHPSWASSARKKAAADYGRAVQKRAELESRPQRSRSIEDYRELILAFQAVYKADPAYEKSPEALADAAHLSEEMGWQFSDKRYYVASIEDYRFLIIQYPGSSLSRDALFTMGEIYRVDLSEPHEARKIFERFVTEYPGAPKARLAREKLKQIQQFEAKGDSGSPRVLEGDLPPEPGIGATAAAKAGTGSTEAETRNEAGADAPGDNSPAAEARETEPARAGSLPEVTGVRFWTGSNYTRVVIALDDEVRFSSTRLAHPDRLVFDLAGCRLSSSVAGKTFPIEDGGFLRQVRLAQFKPSVARAVLDVEKIGQYSIFSLPNPFRLVIDVHGSPAETRSAGASRVLNNRAAAESPASERLTPGASRSQAAGEANDADRGYETAAVKRPAAPDALLQPAEAPASAEDARSPALRAGASLATERGTGARQEQVRRSGAGGRNASASADTAAPEVGAGDGSPDHSRTLTRVLGLKIARIVIDPGHGGHDTGALGPHGLREKDLVLDVGLRLRNLLQRRTQAEVVMTRSDDTFIPLEERTAIANQKAADLFISIHANASRDPSARAVETYYLNFTSDPGALEVAARENATSTQSVHELQSLVKKIVLTEKIQESRDFAADVQNSLYSGLTAAGAREENHGVKRAPFVVLIGASMPSILAEISFVTNPRDEKLLKRPEYRQKIAEALYRGIEGYTRNLGGLRLADERREPVLRASRDTRHTPAIATVAPSIPAK